MYTVLQTIARRYIQMVYIAVVLSRSGFLAGSASKSRNRPSGSTWVKICDKTQLGVKTSVSQFWFSKAQTNNSWEFKNRLKNWTSDSFWGSEESLQEPSDTILERMKICHKNRFDDSDGSLGGFWFLVVGTRS
jgi:hypothetical protein